MTQVVGRTRWRSEQLFWGLQYSQFCYGSQQNCLGSTAHHCEQFSLVCFCFVLLMVMSHHVIHNCLLEVLVDILFPVFITMCTYIHIYIYIYTYSHTRTLTHLHTKHFRQYNIVVIWWYLVMELTNIFIFLLQHVLFLLHFGSCQNCMSSANLVAEIHWKL